MRFRKNKRVEFVILKQMDGEWEYWHGDFATEREAQAVWRTDYEADTSFRVVRYDMTMLPVPASKKAKRKSGRPDKGAIDVIAVDLRG